MIQIDITLSREQENKDKIILLASDLNKARSTYFKKIHDSISKKTYADALYNLFDTIHDSKLYDYASQLLKLQSKTENGKLKNKNETECIKKERGQIRNLHTLNDILKDLTDARTDYVQNPDSESSMDKYIMEQERLAECAVETDLHDYVIKLLQSQKQRGSPELASHIDDDIQAVHDKKLEYDTAPRKINFSFSIRNNAFRLDNPDTVALEKIHTASVTIPPKRPFKALIIKAQKLFRNITDSLHMTEKQPDNAGQTEKNTPVDKEEKSEKEETYRIELYGTSAVKWNGYIDFIGTDEALKEIGLQTGLILEQKAVQEHFRQQEQVQVEMKKKSKEIEYGD